MKRFKTPMFPKEMVRKSFALALSLYLFIPGIIQAQDITVQKTERIDLSGVKRIHVYNLKGMDVKVKNNTASDFGYKVFIKANESALLRNFGGGRVYTEVKDDVLEVFLKTEDKDENGTSKSTWIKSLFSSSPIEINEVKEAILEIDLPNGFDIKVSARYSNMNFEPIDGNIEVTNRSGKVDIHGSTKDVTVKNDYGKVRVEHVAGNTKVVSRSGESTFNDLTGNLELESNYSTVRLERINGNVTVENKSGSVKAELLGGDYIHQGDYTVIKLKKVKGTVNISNKSGSLEFEDIGGLQFKGGYSDITGEDIRSNRLVTIDTKSSSIKIKRIQGAISIDGSYMKIGLSDLSDNLKIYNKSGTIDVSQIKGNVRIDGEYNQVEVTGFIGTYFEIDNRSGDVRADIDGSKLERLSIRNRYAGISLKWSSISIQKGILRTTHGKINAEPLRNLFSREVKMDSEETIELKGTGKAQIEIEAENGQIDIQ